MRWGFLVLAIVSGVGAVGTASVAWRVPAEQGLIAPRPVHDFGETEQGAKLTCEFELVNRTDETLTVKELIEDCGCSVVTCEPKVLPPGAKAVVSAAWNVGSRRGKSRVRIFAVTESSSDVRLATELTMRAIVKPDIEYAPAALEFSREVTKRSVVFSPGRLAEFALSQVNCSHRAFAARLVGKDTVEVTFDPSLWNTDVGPGELRVQTSSDRQAVCSIPLGVTGFATKDAAPSR